MWRIILWALAAIVLIFIIVVAIQPSELRVERTTTIKTSPAAVFEQIDDFHNWQAWSPWAKLDPDATIAFEGPEAGQGAVMTWSGNDKVGTGKMTLLESRPNEGIKARVDFVKPYEGTSTSEFSLKPETGQTVVVWTVAAHQNFLEKAMCLVMNGKKMVGDDLEKGLSQLKSTVESQNGN
jgi:carbon monoxide dehydrogenase subunit G